MGDLGPITVGLDRSLSPWGAEVKYVFRTLLRIAGYPYEFVWAEPAKAQRLDIYYGFQGEHATASVSIRACGKNFADAGSLEPLGLHENDGVQFLDFTCGRGGVDRSANGLRFSNDIVFASYWLLTGAREPHYRRTRWGDLELGGSFFLKHSLVSKPLVSIYGSLLRKHFRQLGREPLECPWAPREGGAAFAFSHDVDYPQMIRWIECLRLCAARGLRGLGSIWGVLRGTNHFWRFADWVEFERKLGTRPTFYFMARRGSLLQYATGTPDGFYDVRAPEFRQLFGYLRGEGCEIGLHASYNAYRSTQRLAEEKAVLAEAAGAPIDGVRHHYWHVDPLAPNDTLGKQAEAGFLYDSSLAFEFYPGFRRGICHPFRPFHPGERRELGVVELPPTWMDNHFDRRLVENGITDPEDYATALVKVCEATDGMVMVDYHVRGMNEDFFPRWGPWLERFVMQRLESSVIFQTPNVIARGYIEFEKRLAAQSTDRANLLGLEVTGDATLADFDVGRMRPDEVPAVAQLHFEFFGGAGGHGRSLANLGREFLESVLYGLNVDNPYLFVDVARLRGDIIGFSVYSSDWRKVSRETLSRHWWSVLGFMLRRSVQSPVRVARYVLGNFAFLLEGIPPVVRDVRAWYMLLGVKRQFRTREFRERTGIWVNGLLWDNMVRTLRAQGCDELWTAPGVHNGPINQLFVKKGAELVARGRVQGMLCNFYRQPLGETSGPGQ